MDPDFRDAEEQGPQAVLDWLAALPNEIKGRANSKYNWAGLASISGDRAETELDANEALLWARLAIAINECIAENAENGGLLQSSTDFSSMYARGVAIRKLHALGKESDREEILARWVAGMIFADPEVVEDMIQKWIGDQSAECIRIGLLN